MSNENETCEYCDRLVNSPNFAYHFCSGRKSGKQAAEHRVQLTAWRRSMLVRLGNYLSRLGSRLAKARGN